ncbi:MAG: murein biosynthesis integral membrane protein MurJ [Candidatus Anammoxibacter sp.]
MSDNNFIRSLKTVSFYTFLSRILGLARDILCASVFGTGMVWDAFTIAFRIPNLFRRLFGEGALSAAFVPVFTEYREKNSKIEAWNLVRNLGTLIIIILAGIVVVGEILFYTVPHLTHLSQKWNMVFGLLLIMFPYVMFICLVAFSMAILNSCRHFLVPALTPIILNICWISGLLVVTSGHVDYPGKMIFGVALAILIAGVLQLAVQIPVLKRYGLEFKPSFNFAHPAIKRIFKLMGPTIFGLAIVQINVLLDSVIAVGFAPSEAGNQTFHLFGKEIFYPLETGAASVLYYGDRLIQFPLGVFGIALANVIFPLFSKHAANEEWDNFRLTLDKAIRLILFIGIPASVGLILLRLPLVELFYERNEFDVESTGRTTNVIFFYAIAIWSYCGLHVIVRAFYSLKDTKTPMKVGVCMVVVNLILNLTLIWFLNAGGLALATSISAILQFTILSIILKKRLAIILNRGIILSLCKTGIATIAMAISCLSVQNIVFASIPDGSFVSKLAGLFMPLTAALITFFVANYLMKSEELRQLIKRDKGDFAENHSQSS